MKRLKAQGSGLRTAALLLAALVLAAPAAQVPAKRHVAERRVPFAAGEKLTYEISWSSFVTAGSATISVREKKPSYGSVAYYVTAEGASTSLVAALYPVYYKADSLVDVYTLLPQRASVFSRERGEQEMKVTSFDHARRNARFEITTGETRDGTGRRNSHDIPVPAGIHDPLSMLFSMRTLEMRSGAKATVSVLFDGTIYKVQLTVGGREQVRAGRTSRRAWRVTPLVVDGGGHESPRRMAVWISDDSRRLPLRMEVELPVGRFELVLVGQ